MPNSPQNRLDWLHAEIKRLAARNDPYARLDAAGNDPVSQTAKAINHLLNRLDRHHDKLRELTEFFQEIFWVMNNRTKRVSFLNGAGDLSPDPSRWIAEAHPEDREAVRTMLRKQQEGEAGQTEFRMIHPKDGIRWLCCRYIPIESFGGRITKTIGVFEDVTDRHREIRAFAAVK